MTTKAKKRVQILTDKNLIPDESGELLVHCPDCEGGKIKRTIEVGGVEFAIIEDCPTCHGSCFISVHERARKDIRSVKSTLITETLDLLAILIVGTVTLFILSSVAPIEIIIPLGILGVFYLFLFHFLAVTDSLFTLKEQKRNLDILNAYSQNLVEQIKLSQEDSEEDIYIDQTHQGDHPLTLSVGR